MGIPGQNLLKMAFSIIAKETVIYYKYAGRASNSVGQWVTTYASPVLIKGSFQPVPKQEYENLGLDWNKSYFNFYISQQILDVKRDVSGDQLGFYGRRYQCLSITPWINIDGWNAVLCVDIGADGGQ